MTNQVPNKANDFCRHPVYDRWEANREGVVRHIVNKKDLGSLNKHGYIHITVVFKDRDTKKIIKNIDLFSSVLTGK